MIYLSANGEVLGQFEESAVPQMLSDGKISAGAFYWREGMAEWRSVTELAKPAQPKAETKPILPRLVAAPVAVQAATPTPTVNPAPMAKPVVGVATPVATKPIAAWPTSGVTRADVAPTAGPVIEAHKISLPQRTAVSEDMVSVRPSTPAQRPVAALASPPSEGAGVAEETPGVSAPAAAVAKTLAPRRAPSAKPQAAEGPQPLRTAAEAAPVVAAGGKRKSWFVWLLALLLLVPGAGGGAWWWLNRAPAAIPGRVSLAEDESGPVEIRVFRREELAGPWRERLSAADARAAELEKLLAEAQASHREKSILYDEAAGVCAAGEEYNMPDVEELRADRDAKKAEADAAKAGLDKLRAEKETLLTFESLLRAVPEPLQTIVADTQGNFLLPPPEAGDVVLLATAASESDGQRVSRGWLEVLKMPADGEAPGAVQFSEANRLDVDEIRRFAGGTP